MHYTLIIHGYSDCSESYRKLKELLVRNGVGGVEEILYVDYESREDDLTMNDVADGLNEELIKRNLIHRDGSTEHTFNVIVHSTGGLAIRHWISCYYAAKPHLGMDRCPVKKIIMLAPANFGSPLAHRGKSFLGSLVKGRWKVGDLLEVGRSILDSLELASPFQWDLAHRDLLVKDPWYSRDKIQVTIMVGADDYHGIRGLANTPGSDGTVVISGTSLDTAKICLDFSMPPEDSGKSYVPFRWAETNPPCDFAFTVLEGLDHGTIVESIDPNNANVVGNLIMEALQQTEASFGAFVAKLDALRLQTYANTGKPVFQQFIIRAVDDLGAPVKDFNLEFHLVKVGRVADHLVPAEREDLSEEEEDLSAQLQAIMSDQFHMNCKDSSFRRMLVNLNDLKDLLARAKQQLDSHVAVTVRIYVPDVERGIRYRTDSLQNILLYASNAENTISFIYDNTTTLIEMKVDRCNDYVSVQQDPRSH